MAVPCPHQWLFWREETPFEISDVLVTVLQAI